MYSKILVPLDGSKTAECVLGHIIEIAGGCTQVELLFVAEPAPPGLYESREEAHKKLMAWGKEYLAGVEDILTKDGVGAKSVIVEGKAAETIVDYAENNGVDLIVMSTHGRSGPSRWAFGSVAEKIIRSSIIPVLIVVPKACRTNR
ncbi:MAG: universal stress protein [Dehalococcoidales bacterium]|nr:universal stress protein [Dehalococcoidales bacterium]